MTTMIPRLRIWSARTVTLAALSIAAILAAAGLVSAHATLLYTTPAAETADPTPPEIVVLVMGEAVTVAPGGVTVSGATGAAVPIEAPQSAKDGHAITAHLPQTLGTGVHTVSWRATGPDGDLVEGRFRFAVGATLNPLTNVDTGGGPSWPTTVYRFVLLAGLILAVGGIHRRPHGPPRPHHQPRARH
jgi:copper transport protein